MNLKEKAKLLPEKAGVYLMKDAMDHVIYVGKSKNLRQRVKQYFQSMKSQSPKVERMMGVVKDFQYIVTDTELEALVLECRLIKEIKPFYNRLMKNDQGYAYIHISIEDEFPRLSIVYNPADQGLYFGPFAKSSMAEKILELIHKYFQIRRCSSQRIPKGGGCLNYQLHNCLGACIESCDHKAYREEIDKAVSFLEGRDQSLLIFLQEKMAAAAAQLEYHKAAIYRDELALAKMLNQRQKAIKTIEKQRDLLAVELLNGKQAKLFYIRNYKLWLKRRILLEGKSKEVLLEELKEFIFLQLNEENTEKQKRLKREALDEAQILYHYLQGKRKNLFSMKLPKHPFSQKASRKLEEDLEKLVEKLYHQIGCIEE
ncbi:GIY-YIG nuclease family protein [Geosporobacter ferrireducens]|uniref:GIY-YIG domain-containing protein n=1 Tax=Geosporobacter ferrireducens TaxID=1424294 RepID=A0A1D8GIR0_9FIRM|nr:GIY-YIG nuclease family protein [Geosporobacter ferrireducens]AOT70805.1 hypothetical protein Gferi_15320 [Geosporobacter ferrireducens]